MPDSTIPQSLIDFIDRNKIDLDKVTPDQMRNGVKIVTAAEKYKLNPDFPLSMAWQESKFKSDAKNPDSTAFGVMQLIDSTAKGLGVDSKDNDQNIDGGMRLIKELMANKRIGNDPNKVLAGYFSGPSSKFLDTGVIEDLTPSEAKHFNAVFQFVGQDELPHLTAPEASAGDQQTVAGEVPKIPTAGQALATAGTTSTVPAMDIPVLPAAYLGAKVGAGLGGAAALGSAKVDTFKTAWDALRGKPSASVLSEPAVRASEWPGTRTPATTVQPAAIESNAAQRLFEGSKDTAGLSGRERQVAYTEATAQQAARAKLQAKNAARLGLNSENVLAAYPGVSSTESGTIITKELRDKLAAEEIVRQNKLALAAAAELNAKQKAADLLRAENLNKITPIGEKYQEIAAKKAAELAAEAGKTSSPLWSYLKHLGSFPVKGALAGLSSFGEAADAYNRFNAGDKSGAAVGGLGAAAGAIAPFVASAGALPAASVAAPLYLMASDRLKYLQKHPEEYKLQEDNYDAMGNVIR